MHLYACTASETSDHAAGNKTLSELDPYETYSCVGIQSKNGSTLRTKDVNVTLDCGTLSSFESSCELVTGSKTTLTSSILTELEIKSLHAKPTDSTIQLRWKLGSRICPDYVLERTLLHSECKCDRSEEMIGEFGRRCSIL